MRENFTPPKKDGGEREFGMKKCVELGSERDDDGPQLGERHIECF